MSMKLTAPSSLFETVSKSLLDKVRAIIKGHTSVTQEVLIHKLNPVIRGWAMYHRHVVA
ncbi:group II intron maturase-specific domain-containing protein, partial [Paraburkholderia madseniana]